MAVFLSRFSVFLKKSKQGKGRLKIRDSQRVKICKTT